MPDTELIVGDGEMNDMCFPILGGSQSSGERPREKGPWRIKSATVPNAGKDGNRNTHTSVGVQTQTDAKMAQASAPWAHWCAHLLGMNLHKENENMCSQKKNLLCTRTFPALLPTIDPEEKRPTRPSAGEGGNTCLWNEMLLKNKSRLTAKRQMALI